MTAAATFLHRQRELECVGVTDPGRSATIERRGETGSPQDYSGWKGWNKMGSLRYLNAILTVLTLLLALNLWTSWSGAAPMAESAAYGQAVPAPTGVPNAAQQRKEISDQLKKLNETAGQIKAHLDGGVRVRVEAGASQ